MKKIIDMIVSVLVIGILTSSLFINHRIIDLLLIGLTTYYVIELLVKLVIAIRDKTPMKKFLRDNLLYIIFLIPLFRFLRYIKPLQNLRMVLRLTDWLWELVELFVRVIKKSPFKL